jgi:hypothetical protein
MVATAMSIGPGYVAHCAMGVWEFQIWDACRYALGYIGGLLYAAC